MVVGVLALQGSYNEHISALRRLGVKSVEIKKPEQLQTVNYLIIPGGESTTMAKLAEYHNLFPALREFVKTGKPVWGTCAGLIFLANRATGQKLGGQDLIGGLDCMVHRNFFGSQLQSFETELAIPHVAAKEGGPPSFRGVFIRAPAILEVGPEVEVLADFPVPPEKNISSNPAVQTPEVASYLLSCYPLCDIFSSPKPIYTSKHSTSTRKRSAQIHSVLLCKVRWHSILLTSLLNTFVPKVTIFFFLPSGILMFFMMIPFLSAMGESKTSDVSTLTKYDIIPMDR
ncbi:hypothetical protein Leryth_011781 [Lithospermum erythrorhizon]|nr:hypothetical protein Leryth_011781 [Lithospermum erythrorhizon]